MKFPGRIYLARHGQSVWNKTKRVSGQMNPPLSSAGLAQALVLCEYLKSTPLHAVYCSTLDRAVDTAAPIAQTHGLALLQREALKEQHLGVLEGRYRDERDPEAMTLWQQRARTRPDFRVPGGETQAELKERVTGCLNQIFAEQPERTLLIVGHRNTNRVILGTLLCIPEDRWGELRVRSRFLHEIDPAAQRVRTHLLEPESSPRLCQGLIA